MLHNELLHTLALLKVEGIGDVVAKKLIKQCGSAAAVFQTSKKAFVAIDGIGDYLYKNLQEKKSHCLMEIFIDNFFRKFN